MSTIAAAAALSPHGATTQADRGPSPAAPSQQAAATAPPRPAFVISIASLAASTALATLRSGDGQPGRAQTRLAAGRPGGLAQGGGAAPTVSTDAMERANAADTLQWGAAGAVKQGSVLASTQDAGSQPTVRLDLSA